MSSAVASYEFTLDGNGNRVQSTGSQPLKGSLTAGGSTVYGYNAQKNRLLSAVSGSSMSYAYDNEGQLATVGNIGLAFDYNHRLTAVGTDTQFSYDGRGNRLLATRAGVATRYIYDPWGNLMAEANSNGITRKYIYGKGLLAVVDSSGLYCYHFDGTGNTVALTDTTQTVVNSYDYDPFGVILGQQESIPQPFKFVGRYGVMAEPNGLYYMRARYYDPSVGRFISEDPLGFGGGDVNLYAYVKNNPVNWIDPRGLQLNQVFDEEFQYSAPENPAEVNAFYGELGKGGMIATGIAGVPRIAAAAPEAAAAAYPYLIMSAAGTEAGQTALAATNWALWDIYGTGQPGYYYLLTKIWDRSGYNSSQGRPCK